tara:strand:+ start:886 stop:1719 length:834 start_codon:yes stop_codon:yes gene_type:complete
MSNGLNQKSLDRYTTATSIYFYESIDSVMLQAERLLQEGILPPFAVVASKMTNGKGRFGKSWHSECTDNLHLSVALEPVDLEYFRTLSVWNGIEVCKILEQTITDLTFKVKWPNDIYCNQKKVSGMMAECRMPSPTTMLGRLIIGLGLNVNTDIDTFPVNYRKIATSLKIESGIDYDMNHIAVKVIESLIHSHIECKSLKDISTEFNNVDYIKGKNIIHPARGIGTGINSDGALLVETRDNIIESLYTGDIILENENDLYDILANTGCNFFCNYDDK